MDPCIKCKPLCNSVCTFGKSVKHTFSCLKIYTKYEKNVYNFFLDILTSQ